MTYIINGRKKLYSTIFTISKYCAIFVLEENFFKLFCQNKKKNEEFLRI